uniref:Protein RER1 n=1 Tax=Kalanchoe fedtschenkoi TaxID=63787 RepID=A0A7N0UNE5_KALFE
MNPGDDRAFASEWIHAVSRRYQHLLDRSTPFVRRRWVALSVIALIYVLRILIVQGFYLITYALGIYVLSLFIAFLSPQVDPETDDAPSLPVLGSDEFRPFVRRLPEFKFWYSITRAFCVAFVLTFFDVLDVPVFWPILFIYWVMLVISTMKRQLLHMVKYKYVPFTSGKQRYGGREVQSSADEADAS